MVTVLQRYVSAKLEVERYVFLFRENERRGTEGQKDGRTDGCVATLNAAPIGAPRNNKT